MIYLLGQVLDFLIDTIEDAGTPRVIHIFTAVQAFSNSIVVLELLIVGVHVDPIVVTDISSNDVIFIIMALRELWELSHRMGDSLADSELDLLHLFTELRVRR